VDPAVEPNVNRIADLTSNQPTAAIAALASLPAHDRSHA